MTYLLWYFIIMSVAEAVWVTSRVGRHRPPVTTGDAVGTIIVAAAHALAFAWILGELR